MKLKSPTDKPIHVALLNGHAIQIPPEGRDVPQMFRRQAFVNGAIPVGASADDMKEKTDEPTEKQRPEILRDVLRKMRDEGAKLTGAGLPDIREVRKAAGWNVQAVELTDAWNTLE